MRLTVRAPATVANLGPGFDCMALALDLSNEFELDTEADPSVRVTGEGAEELSAGSDNLVVRTIERRVRAAGARLPRFGLTCRNEIPLQRGLGSSASAVVAGLLLADALLATTADADALLAAAIEEEGHPDNAAACLRGGVILAYQDGTSWRAERLRLHPALRPVVLIPDDERIATGEARRALPESVSLADAAFNASRAALAVLALTAQPQLLAPALQDRLHQDVRLALVPGAQRVFRALRGDGFPVCVAGSGPSLLAFDREDRAVPDPGPGWRILRPGIAEAGAILSSS